MALEAMYHWRPYSERASSIADDDELYDLPRNVAVALAFLLSFTPRYRHASASSLAELQERLLMSATQRLIDEIRAMRDGQNTTVADITATDAYDVTATSLLDVRNEIVQLRQEIAQSQANVDELESLLTQILAVL